MAGITTMTTTPKRAIVLFGHGSRDPLWHKPLEAVAHSVAHNDPASVVRCAYLELSLPSPRCEELAGLGCTHVTVLPLFLGVGRHAREDLPVLVEQLRVAYPAIHFALKPAVGEDPRLIQLLAQIAVE
jgi:sirohydrochlorin cobaltochelatase